MIQLPFLRREKFLGRSPGIFLEVAVDSTTPNHTEDSTIGETFQYQQLQEMFLLAKISSGGGGLLILPGRIGKRANINTHPNFVTTRGMSGVVPHLHGVERMT